jgi:Gram-negative bacterial TonB protein C-terminal
MLRGNSSVKTILRAASIVTVTLVCLGFSAWAHVSFQPADVIAATDVQYPNGSVANGVVVMDVSLDSKGGVTGVDVLRDIASLTSVATSSVKAWKFNPASVDGSPQASQIRVVFAFRPHALMAAPPSFVPVLMKGDSSPDEKSGYIPAGIVAGAHPGYPINAATLGAVVVRVRVDRLGKIEHLKVIRDFSPFSQFALSAATQWQFQAATIDGEPISSNVAIAFVFSTPAVHEGR